MFLKITKAWNLLLDGHIEADDFKALKQECEDRILRLEAKLANVNTKPLIKMGVEILVNKVIDSFSRIDDLYLTADVKKQRRMVCLLFLEKLEYDGVRFRTPRPNVVVGLILLINSQLNGLKTAKGSRYENLSVMVAENLQSLNFFENDLGLAAAINDDTIAVQ